MAQFTDDQIARMTPQEAEVARSMNAIEAAGGDPFGDNETGDETQAEDTTEVADETAEDETPEGAEDTEGGTTDEAAEKPAEDTPPVEVEAAAEDAPLDVTPPPVHQLRGEAPEDADQRMKDLRAQRAAVRKKWSEGEITDEELEAQEAPIEDAIDALRQDIVVAKALNKANEQFEENRAQEHVETLRQRGLKSGLAYQVNADGTVGSDVHVFNRQLAALAMDPEWKAKPFAARADEAHRVTALLAGKGAPTPTPTTTPTPTVAKAKPSAPVTLRDVPPAARANDGDDLEQQWKAASGPAAQRLWNRLTQAQQDRLLNDA